MNRSRNNNRGGRRSGRSRRNNFNSNNRNPVVRSRTINGAKLRPVNDPRVVVDTPWNSATLEYAFNFGETTDYAYLSLQNIYEQIVGQLGIDTSPAANYRHLDVRFRSLRVWNLDGGVVELAPADLLRVTEDYVLAYDTALARLKDYPGKNHWATAGYLYPKAVQIPVFRLPPPPSNNWVVAVLAGNRQNSCLLRVDILWRGTPPINPITKAIPLSHENLSSSFEIMQLTSKFSRARVTTLNTPVNEDETMDCD